MIQALTVRVVAVEVGLTERIPGSDRSRSFEVLNDVTSDRVAGHGLIDPLPGDTDDRLHRYLARLS